ncbi:GH39 family glycosyl hydrolase, partial [Cohnella zeiphila]
VAQALRKLNPRLIRTFIQEYFHIYPERGRFDWSTLDPYMDSLASVGGTVAAAITIKPRPLFPEVDEKIVHPNDWAEWQEVVYRLVRRYSAEKKIVTRWEIGNEVDIGEIGGSPYLFQSAEDYNRFYERTAEAILRAYPEAKVGGPALADSGSPLMAGLIEHCARRGIPLDFVSWHVYSNNPARHSDQVERVRRELLKHYPADRVPEMMVTEWNRWFDPVSVPEQAGAPERSAFVASA